LATAARLAFAIILPPLAVLWFGGLEYRGLFEPDKGRYAEIPRAMLEIDESLPFYLGRTFTLVSYQGELGRGIAADPGKYVESLEEFKRRWVASDDAYAAMPPPAGPAKR
jgi:Aminoarabinose transferase C-terminal domain